MTVVEYVGGGGAPALHGGGIAYCPLRIARGARGSKGNREKAMTYSNTPRVYVACTHFRQWQFAKKKISTGKQLWKRKIQQNLEVTRLEYTCAKSAPCSFCIVYCIQSSLLRIHA